MIIVFNTETGETKTDAIKITVEDLQRLDYMFSEIVKELTKIKAITLTGGEKAIPLEA